MKPYHPSNLKLTPYTGWRIIVLAYVAKALGVRFHIHGIPFGGHRLSPFRQTVWDIRNRPSVNGLTGGRTIRVDREGNAIVPERKVVLKAKGA